MNRHPLLHLLSILALTTLQACTLYEGCQKEFGEDSDAGIALKLACSGGVIAREEWNLDFAYRKCDSTNLGAKAREACRRGVQMREDNREGRILRPGIDTPPAKIPQLIQRKKAN